MKVAVLLSGGVDSSVALQRLVAAGHEVEAFYLKIWLEDELSYLGNCPWEEDLEFARAVCAQTNTRLEVISLQREYHEQVVAWALAELRAGRTPSPDVLCNQRIKFGAFLDLLDRERAHFERIASGHYARLATSVAGESLLLRGRDPLKDQTYFLFQLEQRQLQRALFPIGDLLKTEVRAEAARLGLSSQNRKDSQGICFLGKIAFDEFVRHHLGERLGQIRRYETGAKLGNHRGQHFFTIGQRQGLGLGGGPWYVVAKDLEENTVWVCHGNDLNLHRRRSFEVRNVHWSSNRSRPERIEVRVRHSPRAAAARMSAAGTDISIELDEGDQGLAPGQVAVLYDGEVCLGGGQISLPTDLPLAVKSRSTMVSDRASNRSPLR